MAKCEVCGKSLQHGNNVSHSKRHTGRTWTANVQRVKLMVDGQPKRVNICTRCLRTVHKG
ncbi:MAG: 50S ribosomal protein L28 [Chloroflexi bacterium]|nr:50S ribosomal protein L28 [Chloroflexota bacterium]